MTGTKHTDWRSFDRLPDTICDVLAHYYDAGLNRFLVQRFCGCIVHDFTVYWVSPFPDDDIRIDLQARGYRLFRWRPVPELPPELREVLPGIVEPRSGE